MNPEAMKPFGLALLDCYNGDIEATVTIVRDDECIDHFPIGDFFMTSTAINTHDKVALDNCRGRILDVGAGTGIHSLALQEQGFSVCAVDISPEACEIMRKRGVNEAHCVDIYDFQAEPFDTVLMLGRSIGLVENLTGLDHFLKDIHRLVKSTGQIILNSLDIRLTGNPKSLAYQEMNRQAGKYFGEIRMHFEYKGVEGPIYGYLHVDSETLVDHAAKAGWVCAVIIQEENGNYLAKLTNSR